LAATLILSLAVTGCNPPAAEDSQTGVQAPTILLEFAVREDGTATELWTNGTAISIGENRARALARENRPFSADAAAWNEKLDKSLPLVAQRVGELARLFDVAPLDAQIVVGNRGSWDAFGWVPNHIGINAQAFADTYGPPSDDAADRVVRIAAHEYLHLLTYAHYENHQELRRTPFDRALWTMFFEGIGDYVSVSARWLPDEQGNYSSVTADTLKKLEPVFVERLEELAFASDEQEQDLRAGLSIGKFDEKWGSLPVALWLHSEVKRCGESATLRAMFRLERAGVLELALRHAAPELRPRINKLQSIVEGQTDGNRVRAEGCIALQKGM
jgi:hypothetical protein